MMLTRSNVLATVVVFLVVAGCLRLGFWQLDRRSQRLDHNATLAERMASAPVELGSAPADTTGLIHRAARARGTYDHDRAIILGARSHRGVPGVHVLTPLRLDDGSAVLVNRGWVPSPDAATVDLVAVTRPATDAAEGVLVAFPDVRLPPGDEAFRTRWFRLDGEAIRAQYPYRVAPLYLQATGPAPEAGAPVLTPVPLGVPTLNAGPHLSYAVQWFSFAAIFLFGWAALMIRGAGRSVGRDAGPDAGPDG